MEIHSPAFSFSLWLIKKRGLFKGQMMLTLGRFRLIFRGSFVAGWLQIFH